MTVLAIVFIIGGLLDLLGFLHVSENATWFVAPSILLSAMAKNLRGKSPGRRPALFFGAQLLFWLGLCCILASMIYLQISLYIVGSALAVAAIVATNLAVSNC